MNFTIFDEVLAIFQWHVLTEVVIDVRDEICTSGASDGVRLSDTHSTDGDIIDLSIIQYISVLS